MIEEFDAFRAETGDQAEQHLRSLCDDAIEASRRNRDLLAQVNRDVRVQVGSIVGSVRSLKQASLAPADSAHLDSISSRCDLLLGLMDDLAALLRISGGEIELPLQSCKRAGLVDEALTLVKPADQAERQMHRTTHAAVSGGEIKQLELTVRHTGCEIGSESPLEPCVIDPALPAERASPAAVRPSTAAQAPDRRPGGHTLEDRLAPYRNMATRCPLKILSADDNHVNREMLQRMLELLGYQTDVVSNGDEAVRAARRVAYDVILLDILMPHLDGVGATETIREDADDEQQPYIVAVTANAMAGERERFLDSGMDAYLAKPFDLCELAVVLEQAYGSRIRPGLPPRPAMLGTATVPLDLDTLHDRLGNATDGLLKKVIPIFLRELPGRMVRLADAYGQQDHADFGWVCHSLKGSSLSVGARQLADLCSTLQMQAESRLLPDTQTFARLEELCHLTAAALTAKLDSLGCR